MISLHNDIVKAIVNTLVMEDPEAKLLYLQSINNESGEGTQNSSSKRNWDYRYNTLIEIAKKFGLKHVKINRGKLWEAILILGLENELYVFFSHKNLKKIIKKGKNNHYLKLLNLFNGALDEMIPLESQLTAFSYSEDEDVEDLKVQARLMLNMMEGDPSKVFAFTFDYSFSPTVKAFAFNTKHEVVWESEDLTGLIDVNYRLVVKDDTIRPEKRENKNVPETKKEKKQIVSLKNIK